MIYEEFNENPLGCFAISMSYPNNINKPMVPIVQEVLHRKFKQIKELTFQTKGYDTQMVHQVLTPNSQLKITEI